jgi:hypothetical protein
MSTSFESLYDRAYRVACEYRSQWLGKDGIFAVYADVWESEVHVRYRGGERPEWLPREIDGVSVVALWGGAS